MNKSNKLYKKYNLYLKYLSNKYFIKIRFRIFIKNSINYN